MWPSDVMFFGGDLEGQMRELCEGLGLELRCRSAVFVL